MKVKIKRLKDCNVEGDKRQYAPFVVKWTCPEGHENELDFTGTDYFSYPVFGEPKERDLYCDECGEERGTVKLILDLTLKVAP